MCRCSVPSLNIYKNIYSITKNYFYNYIYLSVAAHFLLWLRSTKFAVHSITVPNVFMILPTVSARSFGTAFFSTASNHRIIVFENTCCRES